MCNPMIGIGRLDMRFLGAVLVLTLVYIAAAKFGLSLAFATKQVTAVWPPTGVALVALLLFGYRVWPGIALGAFIINSTLGEPLLTTAGIAIGNTIGPLAGAFMLRRFTNFDNSFATTRDVFALLVFGSMLAMMVTAVNGVTNLALGGIIPWTDFMSIVWVWWVGDAMGVLLFAPFLLTWIANPYIKWRGTRLMELGTLYATLAVVSYFVFTETSGYQIQYAVFPLIIWAALRFGQRETATSVLVLCGFAIWGAVHDRGPFVTGTLDERLILLEVFMSVVAVAALILSAVTAERERAEELLLRAHDELEIRVRERTADLAAANVELAHKNEEVAAFVYTVSHDLRAPLVNLQGFTRELEVSCQDLEKILQDVKLPSSVEMEVKSIISDGIGGALRFIRAGTTKFQRLIDALLMLSRTGRQDYRADDVDVRVVVNTTIESLQQSIDQKGTRVVFNGTLPNAIGDVTAIGQVFSNLITNALNYLKPERPGLIEIGSETKGGEVHYWIKDNGVGISSSARPRLFQVFQRFRPELAPGEGMGLAIVKRVVERHGGRLWADSEENVGTTFHFTLRAARSDGE